MVEVLIEAMSRSNCSRPKDCERAVVVDEDSKESDEDHWQK